MIYAYYFERDAGNSHLSLSNWLAALHAVRGVRQVCSPDSGLGEWIGYFASSGRGPHFHESPDRAHDGEVFFPLPERWYRVFYWHALDKRLGMPGFGVVTFESSLGPQEQEPVWSAAQALANRLGAKLVSEDETAYER